MSLLRFRLWAVNALIATILALVAIDVLPQPPSALRNFTQPLVQRVGLSQYWNVFAPPDGLNMRVRAEISYRDGRTAVWQSPDWPQLSVWERNAGHRHEEWLDNAWGQQNAAAWPGWARRLAKLMRPDLPEADRGATVKIILLESPVRSAEFKPWTSWRTPPKFEQPGTLTIEKLP
jgi:hypothetical protein